MNQSIVLQICERHGIAPELFFSPMRSRKLAACRRDAIVALYGAGFNQRAIGRLIRRDASTVKYWLHPKARKRKLAVMRKRKAWKKSLRPVEEQRASA